MTAKKDDETKTNAPVRPPIAPDPKAHKAAGAKNDGGEGDAATPPTAHPESDHVDQPDRPGVGAVELDAPKVKGGQKVREKAGEEPKPASAKSLRPADPHVPDDKGLQHALRKEGRLFRVRGGGETRLVEASDAEEAVACFVADVNGTEFEPDAEKRREMKAKGTEPKKLKKDDKDATGEAARTAEAVKGVLTGMGLGENRGPVTEETCSAFKLPE
jgi:hypothetical protein